jgi:hypothetical protein
MNVIQNHHSAASTPDRDDELQAVIAAIAPQYRHMVVALARELSARHPNQPAPRALRLVQA